MSTVPTTDDEARWVLHWEGKYNTPGPRTFGRGGGISPSNLVKLLAILRRQGINVVTAEEYGAYQARNTAATQEGLALAEPSFDAVWGTVTV